MKNSTKSRTVATLLSVFFGNLGIHRFYADKTATGIIMLVLTLSFVGIIVSIIWNFIDFIMIVCGVFKDKEGNLITDWKA